MCLIGESRSLCNFNRWRTLSADHRHGRSAIPPVSWRVSGARLEGMRRPACRKPRRLRRVGHRNAPMRRLADRVAGFRRSAALAYPDGLGNSSESGSQTSGQPPPPADAPAAGSWGYRQRRHARGHLPCAPSARRADAMHLQVPEDLRPVDPGPDFPPGRHGSLPAAADPRVGQAKITGTWLGWNPVSMKCHPTCARGAGASPRCRGDALVMLGQTALADPVRGRDLAGDRRWPSPERPIIRPVGGSHQRTDAGRSTRHPRCAPPARRQAAAPVR